MKMWVTQCIFLRSSTFYHVNLGKSQFSCLDMRFTKVSTRFVKEVFKLDVDIFHQRQPNCKLYSYERATKKENSTISSWDWGRYRSEEMSPFAYLALKNKFLDGLFGKLFLTSSNYESWRDLNFWLFKTFPCLWCSIAKIWWSQVDTKSVQCEPPD